MRLSAGIMGATALMMVGLQDGVQARGFGVARGGYAVGGYRGGVAGGYRGGAYVGPRGTTVQAGRVGGVAAGPFGGYHAGGAQGVRVTTPYGRTYATGSAGNFGRTAYGGVYGHRVGGTVARGPYGGVAVGGRTGYVGGPFGGYGYRAGGVAVGGRGIGWGTRYVSPVGLRTTAGYVRTGFTYNCFTPAWYRAHSYAWVAPRWGYANYWLAPAWPTVSVYCGITAPPIVYDYGSNVVINNNYIYNNGAQVASTEDYAAQATQFANLGREAKPTDEEEWDSLGVFGMIQGDEKTAQNIFQLAINKKGIIRGNYYDAISDSSLPVYGSVDKKTQRAAWSIGDKKTVVFEAGLNNLTQEQTTILVHYGKEKTQQMELVRLEEPKDVDKKEEKKKDE